MSPNLRNEPLGEIDAGDTIVYANDPAQVRESEKAGLARLMRMLPPAQAQEYTQLWEELEAGQTADAAYAKAIEPARQAP